MPNTTQRIASVDIYILKWNPKINPREKYLLYLGEEVVVGDCVAVLHQQVGLAVAGDPGDEAGLAAEAGQLAARPRPLVAARARVEVLVAAAGDRDVAEVVPRLPHHVQLVLQTVQLPGQPRLEVFIIIYCLYTFTV